MKEKNSKVSLTRKDRILKVIIYIVMIFAALCCIIPFVLLISSSLTDEMTIVSSGYDIWPKKFSLDAYRYLRMHIVELGRAYLITIMVTVIGTAVNLLITLMLAYSISRKDFPFSRILNFMVIFCMLFNGGLVSTYLVYVDIFHIRNSLLALIVPYLLMSSWNVLLAKSYFQNSVPYSLIEAARIDGAGEFRVFWQIVIPLSLPIIATIGLFVAVSYWNDWYNGMIWISKSELYSYQTLLTQMLTNIQLLKQNPEIQSAAASLPSSSTRMAIAAVGVIPILVAYPFFQKYFVRGIAIGAVKE